MLSIPPSTSPRESITSTRHHFNPIFSFINRTLNAGSTNTPRVVQSKDVASLYITWKHCLAVGGFFFSSFTYKKRGFSSSSSLYLSSFFIRFFFPPPILFSFLCNHLLQLDLKLIETRKNSAPRNRFKLWNGKEGWRLSHTRFLGFLNWVSVKSSSSIRSEIDRDQENFGYPASIYAMKQKKRVEIEWCWISRISELGFGCLKKWVVSRALIRRRERNWMWKVVWELIEGKGGQWWNHIFPDYLQVCSCFLFCMRFLCVVGFCFNEFWIWDDTRFFYFLFIYE